jgi:hypothetical protein
VLITITFALVFAAHLSQLENIDGSTPAKSNPLTDKLGERLLLTAGLVIYALSTNADRQIYLPSRPFSSRKREERLGELHDFVEQSLDIVMENYEDRNVRRSGCYLQSINDRIY